MQKGEHWWTSLEALTHPEPPLLSMALPRWALPVDARDTWPCRSCHQFSHCVVVSLRALNTPSLLCFQEIWLQQEQEYISKEMYKHCLYGYCYHVNETPNFHFPPDLTPAPREVYQGSRHCMNAEMQPLGVPSAWHLLQIFIYVTSCAHAVQVKHSHICWGTSLQLLGWLLLTGSWDIGETAVRDQLLFGTQAKLSLVSFFASSPMPYFLQTAPNLCSKQKYYSYAKPSNNWKYFN